MSGRLGRSIEPWRVVLALVQAASMVTLLVTVAAAPTAQAMNSGVARPPYQAILDDLATLAKAEPQWVTLLDYGRTASGQALRAVKIQDPARRGDDLRPAVLITGATHGNEYLRIVDRLPGWLAANREASPGVRRFFAAGGAVLIVPVVNPEGFTSGRRENDRGVDLNRDFADLSQRVANFHEPESRLLAQWLDRELQSDHLDLRVTVDYHCCGASLLYPVAYGEGASFGQGEHQACEATCQALRSRLGAGYQCGMTADVLGYVDAGTSKDYYAAKYHALAFTFEGKHKVEDGNFLLHASWWDFILGEQAAPRPAS